MRGLFSCCVPARRKVDDDAVEKTKRFHSHDSQYDFLSICSGLDKVANDDDDDDRNEYGSPQSSTRTVINHHTRVVNGVRYHPYSAAFGYSPDCSAEDEHSVPYDFSAHDQLEQEMRLWVVNRYRDPPPPLTPSALPELEDMHPLIKSFVSEIETLADEEHVLRPMELLETLRRALSDPSDQDKLKEVSEDERFKALDFLVAYDTMHRLRWKYPRVQTVVRLIASIPHGEDKSASGWQYENHHGIDLWTKAELDGSFSVRCQSIQKQPLFNAISLINEIDLHPLFMPHLAKAILLHKMTGCGKRAQLLARYIYQMPIPFASRDTVLFAFGCNATQVQGVEGIIISAESVPSENKDWWGYSVPPPDRMVRERVRGMSFVLKPLDSHRTQMTVIANLDKRIAFLPQSFVNWIIKDMIRGLYKNMIKLNLKFEKTEFAKRIIENPHFYDWVKMSLIDQSLSSS